MGVLQIDSVNVCVLTYNPQVLTTFLDDEFSQTNAVACVLQNPLRF
jgi:hypothetical protein